MKLHQKLVLLSLVFCGVVTPLVGCSSPEKTATDTPPAGAPASASSAATAPNAPSAEMMEREKQNTAKMAESQKAGSEAFKKYVESQKK